MREVSVTESVVSVEEEFEAASKRLSFRIFCSVKEMVEAVDVDDEVCVDDDRVLRKCFFFV